MNTRSSENPYICLFADERSVHVQRWVLGLRDLGLKVDLITLIKDDKNDIGGISLGARGKMSYLTKISKLRKLVDNLNPDIFHAHHASSFGFLASFVKHPRKILSVWGSDIVEFPTKSVWNKWIIKKSLSGFDYITATSGFLKSRIEKYISVKTPLKVIPFGIDTALFTLGRKDENKAFKIGITKSLRLKYGHLELLKALKRLIDSGHNIKLIIIGTGGDEIKIKDFSSELGLNSSVKFEGFVPNDQLFAALKNIDIFAMPSVCEEGFGVAAIEASSCGLPVVAAKTGGISEVVVDGLTGILVEPGDDVALAEAIKKLINDPELRRKMGMAGREFVEKNYRWEDNLNTMRNLYLEMMR